jgi:hypothetical protein
MKFYKCHDISLFATLWSYAFDFSTLVCIHDESQLPLEKKELTTKGQNVTRGQRKLKQSGRQRDNLGNNSFLEGRKIISELRRSFKKKWSAILKGLVNHEARKS